jgi:putative phage-type endonuclease
VVSGTTHAEWLKAREEYLTASDVAAVCGLNPWKSRNKAVKEKAFPTGERPAATPMVLGQYLEDGVAGAFGHLTKRTVVRVRSAAGASVLVAHPSIPGLAASPDAVELGPDGTPVAAVEVKVTKGDPEQYGWTPALVQLQIQMACCGLELGHVVACAGSRIAWRMDIRPKAGFLARLSGEVERFWDDVRALRAAGPAPRKGKG